MKLPIAIISGMLLWPLLLGATDYKTPDYQGKTYYEISIDDRGILLTDSLGNITEIPLRQDGERDRAGTDLSSADRDLAEIFTDCAEIHDEITKVGGSTVIDDDECVIGDVVVVGNVTIRGKVGGSVTSTGRVRVKRSAVIRGDVIGREIEVEPGADIWGDVRVTDITGLVEKGWQIDRGSPGALVMLVLIILQIGIVAFVASVFRKGTDRVKDVFHENVFKALLVGFLVLVLLLPAFILLVITVIGIPVALLGLPLGLVGAGFLGLAAFSLFVSDLLGSGHAQQQEGRLMKTITGFLILQAPVIGLFLFELFNISVLSIIFLIISALVFFIIFTSSLGATVLTRFGTRDHREQSARTVQVKVEVDDENR